MSRFLPFLALLVVLAGCSGVPNLGADIRPLRMTDIRTDLAPFAANPRYDYVSFSDEASSELKDGSRSLDAEPLSEDDAAVQYHVIGNQQYDSFFFRSALMAGQLRQLSATMTSYREGELNLSDDSDATFLTLMAAEAIDTLPSLVGDARGLYSQIGALSPGSLPTIQKIRFTQASVQALSNLRPLLDSGTEVDDILNDYQQLQDDLDALE